MTYALLAFALAAVGGLVLASRVLRAKLALLHAALGATGLFLLIAILLQLVHLRPPAPNGLSLLLDAGGFLALAAGADLAADWSIIKASAAAECGWP